MRPLLFASVSLFLAVPLSAADTRPNILYIMADDHAAHAISACGSKINKTPNIDRIARDGMRFNNCLVTNSICTPSRDGLAFGLTPIRPTRFVELPGVGRLSFQPIRQQLWILGEEVFHLLECRQSLGCLPKAG